MARPNYTDSLNGGLALRGWFYLAGSGLTGAVTLLMLISTFVDLLQPSDYGVAEAIGAITGSIFGAAVWTLIGCGVTIALYYAGMERLYPETHSTHAKLKLIAVETSELDTSHVSPRNFYSNASSLEICAFYKTKSVRNESFKMAQLVFEARRRIGLVEK